VIVPIDAGVRGSESFIVHDFVIASHLASPYYVGFWSALNHHGLTDQIPRTVFVATAKPRKPLKILTSTFRFVQLAPKKFIGIEAANFDGAEVRISSKEKTLVDCLDHPRAVLGERAAETRGTGAGDERSARGAPPSSDRPGSVVLTEEQRGLAIAPRGTLRKLYTTAWKRWTPLDELPRRRSRLELDAPLHSPQLELRSEIS